MQTKRVCLWSGPRNISTALMYAFAQRSDTEVVDEPFYAHYLHTTGALHPGRDAVIASMETDVDAVIRDVVLGTCAKPVLFMKQMAHHLVNIDRSFMQETVNILLIRDPKEMLPSLTKVIGIPTLKDTGLKIQAELLTELRQIGQTPPILDAKELLLNPKHVLSILCSQLDIPFEEEMLSWKSGGHSSDGVWAPHWYENVHRSVGFVPYKPKSEPFPTELEDVLSECVPYYEILRADAICSVR
ncbi:sulfotransferase family protein [Candidatus Poribacteria bacterium]|nr:sulfotransferase family protein [Candidatus Poribacteria bacterium]MYF55509.1 sulfotransferase family protein [Candidatus Poribacteria bacterium]